VNGDLGAAGALVTGAEARRRDGPFLSAAITRSGREGLPVHPRWPASLATRRPAVPSATPASLAGKPGSAPRQGRTIALLHWFRRLRIRWEIRDAGFALQLVTVRRLGMFLEDPLAVPGPRS
jgi:hypothetical protein